MLNIQIVSDIHIEKIKSNKVNGLDYITPSAPIIILAGDIGSLYRIEQLQYFFSTIYKYFKYIIYIPGNNEYYYINNNFVSFNTLNERLYTLKKKFSNLFILNKSYIILDNYLFCGCVLWSYFNKNLPIFFKIQGFNKQIYNKKNFIEKNYIKNIISFCKKKNYKPVIITHYPPSKTLLPDSKLKFYFKKLYYNNMDYLFSNNLIWIYGHSHSNINKKIDNTYIITNQKGSNKNLSTFTKNFTLKI